MRQLHKSTSLTLKLALICLLSLVLLIPLFWMSRTIDERERYYKKSVSSVAESWAASQNIAGPFLLVPYIDRADQKNQLKHYIFLPEALNVKADISPELRHRGIFEVVVYQTNLKIQGRFLTQLHQLSADKEFLWKQAKLILHIADLKGIQSLNFLSQGQELSVKQGADELNDTLTGVHTLPNFDQIRKEGHQELNFDITLNLKGTDALNFLPLGKETQVEASSTWPDPSFVGHFLPLNREVTSAGFRATWQIPYLARSIPESFDHKNFNLGKLLDSDSFGVRLIKGANHYHQAERAIKYSYLFILFTFIAFFLFEVVKKVRIHIFQYALTACSLLSFFILLTAVAEHVRFSLAYITAAAAIIIQISLYTFKMIRTLTERIAFVGIFIGLYGCLFMILHLEDYAFLIGALGLFGVLSLTMYYTRNVNWFENEEGATVASGMALKPSPQA